MLSVFNILVNHLSANCQNYFLASHFNGNSLSNILASHFNANSQNKILASHFNANNQSNILTSHHSATFAQGKLPCSHNQRTTLMLTTKATFWLATKVQHSHKASCLVVITKELKATTKSSHQLFVRKKTRRITFVNTIFHQLWGPLSLDKGICSKQ